ncbi:hypothetical protein [Streptomyces yerevanensis]|uniref:hypothetical protein n=1 Tax=Streptomyces yerevanensis TaxID=66378 RepID=UPI0005250993|nr:hypothetical protein [Streptomyces yerevanensis]
MPELHTRLLAFGPDAAESLPKLTWPADGAELRRYAVRTGRDIDDDGVLADTTGRLNSLYGITGDALVLVQPDGYIASIITSRTSGTSGTSDTSGWTTAFTAAARAFTPN